MAPAQNQMNTADVAIAGGSYAGLALALALARALPDLRVIVLDRVMPGAVPAAANDNRASALSAASRQMLTALGVWPRLASDAQPVTEIQITDSSLDAGVRPILVRYDNSVEGGEIATHIVANADLNAALAEAVATEVRVRLMAPAAVAGLRHAETGVVLVLADGREVHAALAVAADGRGSPLRGAAGIKTVSRSYDQIGIVTTVVHAQPHGGRAVQHFLPAGPFAILPLTGNRSCVTWSEGAEEARRVLALTDEAFEAEVQRRFGGRLGAVRVEGGRQSWPLEMHLARSYVSRRLALIGDAAHVVHPIAGQGLNLALRDVAALTEVVADAMRLGLDAGDGESLARYERWRRFDSTQSAMTYDALNTLFANDWALLRSARELGLGLVDRSPALKSWFVHEAAGLTGEVPRLLRGEPV